LAVIVNIFISGTPLVTFYLLIDNSIVCVSIRVVD